MINFKEYTASNSDTRWTLESQIFFFFSRIKWSRHATLYIIVLNQDNKYNGKRDVATIQQ